MSIGADAADQMVREGIQITEAAVRLAALGAKNLAAILFALASNPKSRGATTTRRLVKSGQSLLPVPIPKKYRRKFKREAKLYGILYAPIHGQDTVLVSANQAALINQVKENIGCPPVSLNGEQLAEPLPQHGLFGRRMGAIRSNPAAERLEEMGAENLAALVLAMATGSKKDRMELKKLSGILTNKEGIKTYTLTPENYDAVREQAATFEVPCCGIAGQDTHTLIVRQEDGRKLDTILRNLDVIPARGPEPTQKNSSPHAPSERESGERGTGLQSNMKNDRPSIKPKVSAAKSRAEVIRAATQRMKPAPAVERG